MRLLVDASNVLHVTGVVPPALALSEPSELAQLILRSRYSQADVTLVCDGSRPGMQKLGQFGLIQLHWTGATTADSVIEMLLQKSSHARSYTVVSNDRAVQANARHRGASVLSSDRFLSYLARDANRTRQTNTPLRDVHLDEETTQRWMKELGLNEDTP